MFLQNVLLCSAFLVVAVSANYRWYYDSSEESKEPEKSLEMTFEEFLEWKKYLEQRYPHPLRLADRNLNKLRNTPKASKQNKENDDEKPEIQLFYETLCPYCRDFDPNYFSKMVQKLNSYINVSTYPFGNANMTTEENGSVTVTCQHGDAECYGNMLHSCALEILNNQTLAIVYNGCMMSDKFEDGSDDAAAQECGGELNIEDGLVKKIKECAKSAHGHDLLVNYGKTSKKFEFKHVPYVLINGQQWSGEFTDFFKAVCDTFKNPPGPCKE